MIPLIMKVAADYKESEIISDWQEKGIRHVILRGPSSFCAYLGIPTTHPLSGFHYDQIPLRCHGGLTYSGEFSEKFAMSGWYFYGWDYAHCGDYTISDYFVVSGMSGKNWTEDEVKAECTEVSYMYFEPLVRLAEKIKLS